MAFDGGIRAVLAQTKKRKGTRKGAAEGEERQSRVGKTFLGAF